MDVKQWVREARANKKLSQEKLGDALARTKANIGHWETGKHEPSIDQLEQISKVTEFPLPPLGYQGGTPTTPKPQTVPGAVVPADLGIQSLVIRLGEALSDLDSTDRKQAAAILHDLAISPGSADVMAGKLERLLGESTPKEAKRMRANV